MKGITLKELYEYLYNDREIEFVYDGKEYALQCEEDKNETERFVIYCMIDEVNAQLIAEQKLLKNRNSISKEEVDCILNTKCFNGKSFLEIEKDITVTVIF